MTWAVAFTKPASEFQAVRGIKEAGHRAYCPTAVVVLRGHRRGCGERVARPLFPRYVFAELHDGTFVKLLHARGVTDLIRRSAGGEPATLTDEEFEALRIRVDSGFYDAPRPETPVFAPGQTVQIASDEWGALLGSFVELDGPTRAMVLLDFLGRRVKATVPIDRVKEAAA